MREETPAPVGMFKDPSTGQEIQVLPREGESAEDAMARVKKAHGANPDLGEFQHLHDTFVSIGDALRSGDAQKAHALIKKLNVAIDKPPPAEPVTQPTAEPTDRAFQAQSDAARQAGEYRQRAFSRPLPTQPIIPEPVTYEAYFKRDV